MSTRHLEEEVSPSVSDNNIIKQALNELSSLKWLTPVRSMMSKRSGDFGRQIEASLNELAESEQIMKLQLRKADKAVVIGVEQYQAILDMKKHYEALVEKVRAMELEQAGSEYDQLFQRIASPASRKAADTLFELSEDQLNSAHKG